MYRRLALSYDTMPTHEYLYAIEPSGISMYILYAVLIKWDLISENAVLIAMEWANFLATVNDFDIFSCCIQEYKYKYASRYPYLHLLKRLKGVEKNP